MKDTKMQPATDAVIEELLDRLKAAEKDAAHQKAHAALLAYVARVPVKVKLTLSSSVLIDFEPTALPS